MASNLTRKEMKQDKFAVEVEHTVDFFAAHRQSTLRYGAIALAVILIVAAVFYYRNSQHNVRQQVLGEAIAIANAPVGQATPTGGPNFPTEAARRDAGVKAFNKIMSDYSGSEEAYVAEYYLAADSPNIEEVRKKYQDVADHASARFASLAKLALAQVDVIANRTSDAEKILKDLMDHPTDLVSKEQATIVYARVIAPTRPDEARKLLTQIVTDKDQAAVSQIAVAALGDIPQK